MRKLLALILTCAAASLHAQSCNVHPLPYDSTWGSWLSDGTMHPDRDMVAAGLSLDGLGDALVWKVSTDGTVAWSKRIATIDNQVQLLPYGVIVNGNGEIMVFGERQNNRPYSADRTQFAFVLNASGDLLWGRIYFLSDQFGQYYRLTFGHDVNALSNGWLMTISKSDGIHSLTLGPNGEILDREAYRPSSDPYSCTSSDALVEPNGDRVFTGSSSGNPFVMKTDQAGLVAWSACYGSVPGIPTAIARAANGDYLVAGGQSSSPTYEPEFNPFMMRITSAGAFLWAYQYTSPSCAKDVAELANGDIVLTCTGTTGILHMDQNGQLLGRTASSSTPDGLDLIGVRNDSLFIGRFVLNNIEEPQLLVSTDIGSLTCSGLSPGTLANWTNIPTSTVTDTLFTSTDSTRTWTMALGAPIEMDNMDISVSGGSGGARPGFIVHSYASVSNQMMLSSGPITATMALSPELSYVTATPTPTSVVGNTVTWNLPPLTTLFQNHSIWVQSSLPPDTALLGNVLSNSFSASQDSLEYTLANNTTTFTRIITGSYDPNDKLVFPKDFYHFTNDSILDYTIRFQNTGTDTAFNIVVIDTLPPDVDVLTFQTGVSSHPYTYSLTGEGLLKFTFSNILLPDSNTNESLSHGLVSFRIKPIQPVYMGQTITNEADIYFDFNPPVRTPPATVVVTNLTGIVPQPAPELRVYPVPVRDVLTVELPETFLPRNAIITAADGRTVWTSGVTGAHERLNVPVQQLALGAYQITLLSMNGERLSARFVKE